MLEWVKVLMPYVVAVFTTVFIDRKFFNKGMRSLKAIKEYQNLFDGHETSFTNDFVTQDLEESYFLARTGINANKHAIAKYIAFKERLGSGYSWNAIKDVRDFLNLEGDEIAVNLRKWQIILAYIVLFAGISSIVFGFAILYYYTSYLFAGNIKEFVTIGSIFIFCFIAGMFLMIQAGPIFMARGMKKRLQTRSSRN